MNIYKEKVGYICFTLSAIILNYYFYIISVPADRYNLIIGLVIFTLISFSNFNIMRGSPEGKLVVSYLLMILIQTFISSLKYNQWVFQSLVADKYQFVILMYSVFVLCFGINRKSLEIIEKVIIVVGMICAVLIDIQVLIGLNRGIDFLYLTYGLRAETVRVFASAHFIAIAVALSFARLFMKNKRDEYESSGIKIIYIVSIVAGIINIFLISQTRMLMAISVFVISILFLFKDKGKMLGNYIRKFISIVFVIFIIYVLINSELFSKMMEEFRVQTVSIDNRSNAYEYYWQQITSSFVSFFFGTGFIYDQNTSYLYIIRGIYGGLNRSDVGIVGFIHKFGLMGFCWYLSALVITGKSLIRSWYHNKYSMDLMVLWLYFLLGSGTLCMLDAERIFMFPVLLYASIVYRKETMMDISLIRRSEERYGKNGY